MVPAVRPTRLHAALVLAVVALAACTSKLDGGARVVVSFSRLDSAPACIRVSATDFSSLDASTPLFATTDVSISDRGTMGQVVVGIARAKGWSNELELGASLHLGACTSPLIALARQRVTLTPGTVTAIELTVTQSAPTDAGGTDGGTPDAGPIDGGAAADAGRPDAGPPFDSGTADSGQPTDAGMPVADSGPPPFDAGAFDAGQPDAAVADAGFDAGVFDAGPSCSGAFSAVPAPLSSTFAAVAMYAADIAMLGGTAGSLYVMTSDGGNERWTDNDCSGDFKAIWVQQKSQVFVAGSNGQLVRFTGPGSCTPNAATLAAGTPTSLAAYRLGNNTRVWVGAINPPAINRLEISPLGALVGAPFAYVPNNGLPNNESQIYDVAGTSESNVFAVGYTGGKGFILKLKTSDDLWVDVDGGVSLKRLRAIAFANPTAGFAGGEEFLTYDGTAWTKRSVTPGFEIFGFKVFSPTNVIAVGSEVNGHRFGISQWDGSTWSAISTPMRPSGATTVRIDGTSPCDAWAIGQTGGVVTSNDRP